jgi:predicted ester cyclase
MLPVMVDGIRGKTPGWGLLASVLGFVMLSGCGCAAMEPSVEEQVVVVEEPVAAAPARLLAAWNQGELAALTELVAPDVVREDSGPPIRGLEPYLESIRLMRVAFPDIQVSPMDSRREGDKWIIRWRWSGTHKGPLLGLAPTGRRVNHSGRSIYTFADGRLVHVQVDAEAALLLSQLRGGPGPPAAPTAPAQSSEP